ncbi:glutamyl-tRNA reductase [Hydrogenimonas thermophila]|uniref:Glutamyl-tRNA reductase n=1 Tax=Hydrogenimonas thermophila TaxID=223786 RepID=A0A1I5QLU1_9BACT|nr:glutamyl-tRNA reductase [Hydrogenimonas thermophila]WOE71163.1 glutamyl-tRNA reductase [Hydrogenimonas thermophila]WOE73681.1 glutamyl-tRNA reductase [Hydrogenimonas thermophila]SFP47195.1 glutamyl-tRNA reductase [Hydrogenimonas thermophila]
MQYIVVSYSHKNTDIAVREKLAFSNDEQKKKSLEKVLNVKSINEAILLSTCNRVEFIISTSNPSEALHAVFGTLHLHSGLSIEELEGRADVYEDEGAVHHVFAVASSLDSLVVGETQIAGQLKDAFRFAYENGFCSQKLSRLIHFAFKCAAEVRNCTSISKSPVSVASAAVSQAKEVMGGNLGGYTGLVVGAGEMSEIVAKHLVASGCNVIIFNRSMERAKNIAKSIGERIDVEPFHSLPEYINRYRLLFSATGAPHPIITDEMVDESQFERYWFDLAVPRDIEIVKDKSINIYAVDDLQEIVNTNLSMRREQARKAYEIVGRYTMDFFKWLQTLMIDPLIKDIRERAKESAMKEVERAIKKGFIPPETRKNVEKLVHNAFNNFLHTPTKQLREVAEQPRADTVIEAMKYVFNIDTEVKMMDKYKCEFIMKDDVR